MKINLLFVSRSLPGEYHGRRLGGQFHRHFLPLVKGVGLTSAYAFYAIAAAISLPFVWLTVYETKDKTLEQMKDTDRRRVLRRRA